nr:MAG TPA: hypothetical protein [Caudoviricetes sp.]
MANISVEGLDKLVLALQKADIFDEQTQKQMLYESANIAMDNIADEMIRSNFNIGHLTNRLQKTKIKKNKYGEPVISITAKGHNLTGDRNAAILFVLNYGRSKQYGEITGGYFWTKGVKKSEKEIQKRLEEITKEKLKERGLI